MQVTLKRMRKMWQKDLSMLIDPGVLIPWVSMVLPTSTTLRVKIRFDDDFCKNFDYNVVMAFLQNYYVLFSQYSDSVFLMFVMLFLQ